MIPETSAPEAWPPLLDGKLGARARQALAHLRTDLPGLPVGYGRGDLRGDSALDVGRLGQALFWAELARQHGDPEAFQLAEDCLDSAIEEIASVSVPPGLFAGFLGAGWVATYLDSANLDDGSDGAGERARVDDGPDDDASEEIDVALLASLERRDLVDRGPSLLAGIVGEGVYALARLPRARAVTALERIVDLLESSAEELENGLAWRTPPEALPSDARSTYPHGFYNLGLGHGLAGVIDLLAHVHASDVATERTAFLLEGSMSWLASEVSNAGFGCPQLVLAGSESRAIGFPESRLSWCYGTPGVAVAVAVAARALGRSDWAELAQRLARDASAWPFPPQPDLGLCHGLAGTAHTFHRLHRALADPACADAARRAFAELLRRRASEGGGFPVDPTSPHAGRPNAESRREVGGLLRGSAGIGLALLAALAPEPPRWDAVMLLDQPSSSKASARS